MFTFLIPLSDYIGKFYGSRFCPFHRDINHPSSKLYRDEEGEHLFCFVCRKQYSSFDYVVKVLGENPYKILYSKVDRVKIEMVAKRFMTVKVEKEENQSLRDFKLQKINLEILIDKLYEVKED